MIIVSPKLGINRNRPTIKHATQYHLDKAVARDFKTQERPQLLSSDSYALGGMGYQPAAPACSTPSPPEFINLSYVRNRQTNLLASNHSFYQLSVSKIVARGLWCVFHIGSQQSSRRFKRFVRERRE